MTEQEQYTKKLRDAAIKVLAAPIPEKPSLVVDADALRALLIAVQEYKEPKK